MVGKAKEETDIANEKEKISLALISLKTKNTNTLTKDLLIDELTSQFSGDNTKFKIYSEDGSSIYIIEFTESQRKYKIDENLNIENSSYAGQYFKTDTTIILNEKNKNYKIRIPAGFTISKIPSETSIENGIVIYRGNLSELSWEEWINDEKTPTGEAKSDGYYDVQELYDQFVWIPVKNTIAIDINNDNVVDIEDVKLMMSNEQYPMALPINDENSKVNYRSILYKFSSKTDYNEKEYVEIALQNYNYGTNYYEPGYLAEIDSTSNNNVGITVESLQSQFNNMVEHISLNEGFWMGRYETSNFIISNQVKIIRGTSQGISQGNWYEKYMQQKKYIELTNSLTQNTLSSMIWGCQYDQVVLWMKDVKNVNKNSFYITNSLSMGNFNTNDDLYSGKQITGIDDTFKIKNIFDLSGNLWEWTLEAYGSKYRATRGGSYNSSAVYGVTSIRFPFNTPENSNDEIGSRIVLY